MSIGISSNNITYTSRLIQIFRLCALPLRLRILDFLAHTGEAQRVTEIVVASGEPRQAMVSQHLAVLLHAGILSVERRGNCAFYAIQDPEVYFLLTCVRRLGQEFPPEKATDDVVCLASG